MTEADVTCVVCRSPDTVGPSKLYCGDHEPVGHRDERPVATGPYEPMTRERAERLHAEAHARIRRAMRKLG